MTYVVCPCWLACVIAGLHDGDQIRFVLSGDGDHIRLARQSDSLIPSYGWECGSDLSSGSIPVI
jgi:hypothetical protein